MLDEIKKAPEIMQFLCAVGILEILFNSRVPSAVGIDPHWQLPLFAFLVIVVIVAIIYGIRKRSVDSEPAE